jgi:hypothetical protein
MHTLDEMLLLDLLTPDQHAQLRTWVRTARTPERILQMPAPLWRALELASVQMNFDADLAPPS